MTSRSDSGQQLLAGEWRKADDAPECARRYPDHLTFSTGTTYRGQRGEGQGFIWWDAGTYRLEGENDLLLTVATDELVRYQVTVDGDRLDAEDPDGCRFSYRRVRPPG